jgi:hypothetical protein
MATGSGGGGTGTRLGDHGSWDWRAQQQQQQQQDDGQKQYAPAASRNEAPILEALRAQLLQKSGGAHGGVLLEVACGTGQHCAAFSRALVGENKALSGYLPTDLTDALFPSVRAHAHGLPGVLPPRALDVSLPPHQWFAPSSSSADATNPPPPPPLPLRAILAVNLTHISPWTATLGLLRGAAHFLDPKQGLLLIYGPFTRQGGHVGEGDGNARFDATLRAQDSSWGYRDVDEEVRPAAEREGLELEVVPMPANNLFLVFRRRSKGGGGGGGGAETREG